MLLPSFLALYSGCNQRYLRYMREGEVEGLHGHLQFSGTEVASPWSKFQVETAAEPGLIHIKCCCNNKYWAILEAQDSRFIAACANEKQEDPSARSSTLFQPSFDDDKSLMVRLRHYRSRLYVSLNAGPGHPYTNCLILADDDHQESPETRFQVLNWNSLVILPKYVAFVGDNGNYLSAQTITKKSQKTYLQFSAAAADATNEAVANQVVPRDDGSIRIKSIGSNTFWRCCAEKGFIFSRVWNWIRADDDVETTRDDQNYQVFLPKRVEECIANYITLQNKGTDLLCGRLTHKEKKDCLAAHCPPVPKIPRSVRLTVKEHVQSRQIYNVRYRFGDAKIHREEVRRTYSQTGINEGNTEGDSMTLKFITGEKISYTWKSSVSTKEGGALRIRATIPVFRLQFDYSREYDDAYEWSKSREWSHLTEVSYTTRVPENEKVIIYGTEKVVWSDIPYSYTEEVTLRDGRRITYEMDDGVYTSKYNYDFQFKRMVEWRLALITEKEK